jgi:chitodextrinase
MIGDPPVDPNANLALHKPTSASSSNGGFPAGNAVDANTGSYWESNNNAFPQWLQVDLGAAATVSRLVLRLPAGWGARTQTLSVQGSGNGSTFSTLSASAGRLFDPAAGNTVTITFPAASARYVRLNISANTGWPAAQIADFQVFGQPANPGDTVAPSAPGNLTVTGKTTSSVALSWTASTDNVGVTGYQVRQAGNVVATVTGLSHQVTGLAAATSYTFTVTATDAANNTSAASNAVTTTTDSAPPPNTNLAQGRPTSESSHVQGYGSWNTVDTDAHSYWESNNSAFPQWLQVDLGAAVSVGRVVLKLPPNPAWATRTQTLSVQGSTDGSGFSTLSASSGRVFNPATGNTVTVTFAATAARYVRITVTGNTGWPAGQLSGLEVYAS